MRTPHRTRAIVGGISTAAAIALTSTAPAAAAPYTPNALVSITIAGTLTINILNFDTGELIEIYTTGNDDSPLTSFRANGNGAGSVPVVLPQGLTGRQSLIAVGTESGKTARTDLPVAALRSPATPANRDLDWGSASYTTATPAAGSHTSDVALASMAGLAVIGGAGLLHRRRSHS